MNPPPIPADDPAPAILDPRRKRALFRAWHRGTREMDLIMGRFADQEMARLSEDELALFEALMEEPDPALYDWVTGREEAPAIYDTPLLARLREHRAALTPTSS